jgi:hypothetical protein
VLDCQQNRQTHLDVHSVPVLPRFALRHFVHTNFYNEAHTLRLARHPNANSLIRNLPNITEHETIIIFPSIPIKCVSIHINALNYLSQETKKARKCLFSHRYLQDVFLLILFIFIAYVTM